MNKNSKIFIAGHNGLVGSAVYRLFKSKGFKNLITISKKKLDLKDLKLVNEFDGSNNWVMINSGVPHQAIGINLNETRTTVCFRFVGNPRFESLIKNCKIIKIFH
jgi:hypothetical protein